MMNEDDARRKRDFCRGGKFRRASFYRADVDVAAMRDLSFAAKLGHGYLATRARLAMPWPTLTEVEADLGCARATAVRLLRELSDRGLVTRSGHDIVLACGSEPEPLSGSEPEPRQVQNLNRNGSEPEPQKVQNLNSVPYTRDSGELDTHTDRVRARDVATGDARRREAPRHMSTGTQRPAPLPPRPELHTVRDPLDLDSPEHVSSLDAVWRTWRVVSAERGMHVSPSARGKDYSTCEDIHAAALDLAPRVAAAFGKTPESAFRGVLLTLFEGYADAVAATAKAEGGKELPWRIGFAWSRWSELTAGLAGAARARGGAR